MDAWESHFREKSARRARRRRRAKVMRAGVLLLLFGSLAVALCLWLAGLPR